VNHAWGMDTANADQTTSGAEWVPIGTYTFLESGGSVVLSNQDGEEGKTVCADAVRFVREGTQYDRVYQGMWIYSWGLGFLSAEETKDMIDTARSNNLNCIFPEVRKTGDAYYKSTTEPRGTNIDPGYEDPLADIISRAHDTSEGKPYIEVHAWVVPYRVWKLSMGDVPTSHILNRHPEWLSERYSGDPDPDGNLCLDPGVPGVTDYIVDVVTEIVKNYDVDGIHWDYFRYTEADWGYNPIAIERFNKLYDKEGVPLPNDPDFSDFRRDQVRQMGRKAYAAVKAIRWNCKMSSATIGWGDCPENYFVSSPYSQAYQDFVGFMQEGLLDINVHMGYKREHIANQAHDFRDWTRFVASTKAGRHAIKGHGIYLNSIENSITQILFAMDCPGIDGVSLYVYHQTNKDGFGEGVFWNTARKDCFPKFRETPSAPWIETPTCGILRGTVKNHEGIILDGATVEVSGSADFSLKADGTGFYAFLKLPEGDDYTVAASCDNECSKTLGIAIPAGKVTTLDFVLEEKAEQKPSGFVMR